MEIDLRDRILKLENEIKDLKLENDSLIKHATEAISQKEQIEKDKVISEALAMRRERILEETVFRIANQKEGPADGEYRNLLSKIFTEFEDVRNKYCNN